MSPPQRDPAGRRAAGVIFVTLFVAYGYFHQGGGWNQNIRFAQVRSVVEEGTWWVNRYCAYEARETGAGRGGIGRTPLPDRLPAELDMNRLSSWDVSLFEGRVYPNKPPGTTVLAAPAYAVVWWLETHLGVDPDGWLGLTAALYLTTVLSVGLVGALGGLVFFHLSRRLFPDLEPRHHAAATLAFGLGTLHLPFATMLFDHVPVATVILGGFALMAGVCDEERPRWAPARLLAAGALLGFAVTLNYTAVVAVALLALYLAWRLRPRARWLYFALGGLPPGAFLAWYHDRAFGDVLANANTHQLARYTQEDGRVFGMLGAPDPRALWQLLLSDYRGLFVYSPILLAGVYGLWLMFRRRRRRGEAVLILAVFVAFLLLNASFNGWHGGATFGPRYLIPAVPLLALPLALAFHRRPAPVAVLAVLSVLISLLGTATTPLVHQSVDHPLTGVLLPAFLGLSSEDPVSLASMGAYEIGPLRLFGPESVAARWNAFNAGEMLFPRSRLSLLPLLAVLAAGIGLAVRRRPPPRG